MTYQGIRKAASKEKRLSDLFGCPQFIMPESRQAKSVGGVGSVDSVGDVGSVGF
ncbi:MULTISPECIES: hypothetical protein [Aneurinibacillus]|uniref:hypothetical protein n=1 Tax=Aneurinibacillus TaxID=55079 RepID=UPI000A5C8DBC|nr:MULTISPECIES: hypothetical protein [Aneurinibacillus]MED0673843.1 hypothetical protein [Aneurinibacillus aneurinilyticus]MED0894918.1 hypothetical protein [Aneurinibacillus migulanus]MED1614439.1 hypothetical protein [Aneurinibacillus migulanus]